MARKNNQSADASNEEIDAPIVMTDDTEAQVQADEETEETKAQTEAKPTAFSDVDKAGAVGETGARQDSFGRDGDSPQPRPNVSPDLAEPLHNPAGASSQSTVDAGETTERIHSGMRAAGARQYGLVDPAASQALGEVTDPHHAMTLIRDKTSKLHQVIHNIGNVAEVPVNLVESLLAEIGFLLGVVRRA